MKKAGITGEQVAKLVAGIVLIALIYTAINCALFH